MRRILTIPLATVALVVAGAVAASAGGGGHAGGACLAFTEGDTITMRDSCFEGVAHTAAAGATITVVNQGDLPHTLTAVDGSFDTGTVRPGASRTIALDEPGRQRVYCTLHGTTDGAGMAGVIDVVAAEPASEPAVEPAAAETSGSDVLPWLLSLLVVAGAAYLAGRRTRVRP